MTDSDPHIMTAEARADAIRGSRPLLYLRLLWAWAIEHKPTVSAIAAAVFAVVMFTWGVWRDSSAGAAGVVRIDAARVIHAAEFQALKGDVAELKGAVHVVLPEILESIRDLRGWALGARQPASIPAMTSPSKDTP